VSDYPAGTRAATRTTCARSGRHHVERAVLAGTELCGPCHALFPRVLQDLVNTWPTLLASVMKRPARVYRDMPGGGGDKDASSYWNPAATMVIADITDWYGFMGRLVQRDRPAPAAVQLRQMPRFIGPLRHGEVRADTERTVFSWAINGTEDTRLGLAAVIKWHHRWLSHHPTLGAELLDDAVRWQWAMDQALESTPVRRIRLPGHFCQVIVEETPIGLRLCEGQLVGVIQRPAGETPSGPGGEKPSSLLCSNCPGHAVPAMDWILLGHSQP